MRLKNPTTAAVPPDVGHPKQCLWEAVFQYQPLFCVSSLIRCNETLEFIKKWPSFTLLMHSWLYLNKLIIFNVFLIHIQSLHKNLLNSLGLFCCMNSLRSRDSAASASKWNQLFTHPFTFSPELPQLHWDPRIIIIAWFSWLVLLLIPLVQQRAHVTTGLFLFIRRKKG